MCLVFFLTVNSDDMDAHYSQVLCIMENYRVLSEVGTEYLYIILFNAQVFRILISPTQCACISYSSSTEQSLFRPAKNKISN